MSRHPHLIALVLASLLAPHLHAQSGTSHIDVITIQNGGTNVKTFAAPFKLNFSGCTTAVSGSTVTVSSCVAAGSGIGSIAWTLPSFMSASPATISASGTQTFSFNTQSANLVLAGPTSGIAATPAFRALVAADIPSLPYGTGTVTSFSAGTLSPLFTTSVATATTTPALTFTLSNAAQNSVFAGPAAGGAAAPSFQVAPTFSAANLTNFPTFNQNTTGNAATVTTAASTTNSSFSILVAPSASGNQAPATVSGLTVNPSTGAVAMPGAVSFSGTTHGLTVPAGTAASGATGNVVYASDATSGFAEVNENNTGLSRVCTAANGICTGSGTVTDGAGTTTANQFALSTAVAHVLAYSTAIPSASTATTQAANDNSTKVATTAYVDGKARRWSCQTGLGDGLNAVPAGTYLQSICYNDTGSTVTLAGLKCFTDNAGSSTMNAAGNTLGALLTGAVTCSTSFASGTQSANVALTSGDYIKFTFVADGTSKQTTWEVSGTY